MHAAAPRRLRPLSRLELVEFRMTVDAAIGVGMQTSLHPSPMSSRAS